MAFGSKTPFASPSRSTERHSRTQTQEVQVYIMVLSARTSYTMPYPFNGFASFSALLHNSETTINLSSILQWEINYYWRCDALSGTVVHNQRAQTSCGILSTVLAPPIQDVGSLLTPYWHLTIQKGQSFLNLWIIDDLKCNKKDLRFL